MDILVASPSDIEELTRVEIASKLQSIPEYAGTIAVDYSNRLHRWQNYFNGQSPANAKPERIVFKVVADGHIAGFLAGHLTNRYGKDAEIENFYILKVHQRKGIGSELLNHLLQWLVTQGAGSLCVGIEKDNPYQAFYLKHGGMHLNPHWICWDKLDSVLK